MLVRYTYVCTISAAAALLAALTIVACRQSVQPTYIGGKACCNMVRHERWIGPLDADNKALTGQCNWLYKRHGNGYGVRAHLSSSTSRWRVYVAIVMALATYTPATVTWLHKYT